MCQEVSKSKKQKRGIFGLIKEESQESVSIKGRKGGRHKKKESVFSIGRWKQDEHQRFIDALLKHGNDWKSVQTHIGSRSSTQARSHAQKFFAIIGKIQIENLNLDFENNSLKSLNVMASRLTSEQLSRGIKNLNNLVFEKKKAGKAVNKCELDFNKVRKPVREEDLKMFKGRCRFRTITKRKQIMNLRKLSENVTQNFNPELVILSEPKDFNFSWTPFSFTNDNVSFKSTYEAETTNDDSNFHLIFEKSFSYAFSNQKFSQQFSSIVDEEKEKFGYFMMDVETNSSSNASPRNFRPVSEASENLTDIIDQFMDY